MPTGADWDTQVPNFAVPISMLIRDRGSCHLGLPETRGGRALKRYHTRFIVPGFFCGEAARE